ncbi:Rep [uncultured virus]|uniref:Rep n=1 Tax=uncultured virus TaxID=340016 RepID=A0A2K9LV86_9VIRU|nr:Rep [uncultured virus]AUM62025.1 Rep [uncultured virus]
MPPRNATVRLQSKKYLLTYAQCPLTKEEILESLQGRFSLKAYTIAQELHQDGERHLHAAILLQDSPSTTDMRVFDVNSYHPNIKTLKTTSDYKRASEYCKKDGDFITSDKKSLTAREEMFDELLKNPGGLTREFVLSHPGIMALNFDSIRKWMAYVFPRPIAIPFGKRAKKVNLWCHGPSNSYKSTWLNAYIQCYHCPQEIPRNNDYAGIEQDTDLLFSDEFRGHLSVQELNRLCDGYCKLNTKGGSTVISNPIVVIVSNFSINEIYYKSDPVEIDSVHSRFHQYVFPNLRPKFPTRSYND